MTQLEAAVRSWIDGEDQVRQHAELVGGRLAAELEGHYRMLGCGTKRQQREATRRLRELMLSATANAGTSLAGPTVLPLEWEWGAPGSLEDEEMLQS